MSIILSTLDRITQKLTPDVVRFYSQINPNPLVEAESVFADAASDFDDKTQMIVARQFESKIDRLIKVHGDYLNAASLKIDRDQDFGDFFHEEMKQIIFSSVLCGVCNGKVEDRDFIRISTTRQKDAFGDIERVIISQCDRCFGRGNER